MHTKYLIWSLTVGSLLTPALVSVVRTADAQHGSQAQHASQAASPLPDAVRQATEPFRDVNNAIAAGYAQAPTCVSGQEEGAMGVHFVNFALFDDRLEVDQPEALVYEPRNGRFHLVAAEYITPAEAWDASHEDSDLPALMGHLFHFVPGPNRYGPPAFWELHVWAWKHNPRGTFTDWNPAVSCAEWGTLAF